MRKMENLKVKYLFDMGEVWHVYSDVGNQWIYHRMERVTEEIMKKNGENLPGPLGKLDILKQLEQECGRLKQQVEAVGEEKIVAEKLSEQQKKEMIEIHAQEKKDWDNALESLKEDIRRAEESERRIERELQMLKEKTSQEKETALAIQKEDFEKAYGELKDMAEDFQREGKLWRQRYLDLAYQMSPKGTRE